eukprot:6181471-Pleurochrysis_carterae.AAC.8
MESPPGPSTSNVVIVDGALPCRKEAAKTAKTKQGFIVKSSKLSSQAPASARTRHHTYGTTALSSGAVHERSYLQWLYPKVFKSASLTLS